MSNVKFLIIFFILIVKVNCSYCQNWDSKQPDNEIKGLLIKADSLFNTSNYEGAFQFYHILSEYYRAKEQWDEVVRTNLQIAYTYQIRGIFDSSFYFLNETYKLIRLYEVKNKNLLGTFYFIKGSIQSKTGNSDSALSSLDYSLKYLNDGVNDSLMVLTKRTIGNIHYSTGNYNLSLKYYNDALEIEKTRRVPSEIMQAALFQNIGIVFSTIANYDSARLYLNKSILLKEKTLNATDPQLAIGYLNYGRFLYVTGNPDQALNYYSKAEEIYYLNFGKNYIGLAPIYYNKGSIYIVLRDLNKALTYSERALELYLKTMDKTNPLIGDLYMNLGVVYEEKGDLNKAIQYYDEVLIAQYNSESTVKSFRNLGRCYYDLKDIVKAEKNFKLSINEAINLLGPNHDITAGSYLAYGKFCISIKNYKKAEELLKKALEIRLECFGNKNIDVSLVYVSLGDLYRDQGDFDKALIFYQKAIISNTINFNNENIFINPNIKEVEPEFNKFVTLYKKAYTLYDTYIEKSKSSHYLELSLETSILSIDLFESILASYKDENTKIMTNEYVYDIYNLVVLIASELYSTHNDPKYLNIAFEYSEKGKAAILLSSILGFEAITIGNIPLSIKEMEESLKRDLALLKNFINDESQKSQQDSSKLLNWRKVIFAKTLSYDSLIGSIESNYQDYYNLKYHIDVVGIEEIQRNLKNNEIFIEYKLIDSLLYVFSITKDHTSLNKVKLESGFKETVLSFISSINQFPLESFNKENYLEFIYQGNDLYRTLLNPVIQSDTYHKIILIPDNILGYLPFEALIKEFHVPDKIDFRNLNYVVRSSTISYGYSGTLLFKHFTRGKGNLKLLAMAPAYKNISSKLDESYSGARDISDILNALEYSVKEVNNIFSLFKGKKLVGEDATELNFKNDAERFGILHFAMHTLINDEDPMASKLVFTLNNDSTEDGLLNAYEIYNLRLKASLAVLSACKTGIGKFSKGEGMMSLARGFLYAGVPSIVMTLWEVEDVAGSEIMFSFYKNLKAGLESDEALTAAKLTYLESADPLQSHPYFWAAFVQIGKTEPIIRFTQSKKIMVISVSVIFIVILFLLLNKMLKKRKNRIANSNI
jgi:CHAT domain-containing protein/Tfp pilus assembly protein PilF